MNAFVNGLLTVLTSGIVSALATTFLNYRQAERQLRRSKLEELCLAVAKLRKLMEILRHNFNDLTSRKPSPSQREVNEAIEKMFEAVTDDALRVNTLVAVYFPSLIPALNASAEPMQQLRDTPSEDRKAFMAQIDKIIAARGQLMNAAYRLAPEVNRPIWKVWR